MNKQTQIHISGSISIAEFPLSPTGAAHSYIIFDLGNEITEMHGFPTDKLGNPMEVGMPWDTTDTINYWDTQSLYAKGHLSKSEKYYLDTPENTQMLFTGTVEEVQVKLEAARLAGHKVNAAGLGYMALNQNSNSMTTGLLNAMGLRQPTYRYMTPRSALDLVDAAKDPIGQLRSTLDTGLDRLSGVRDGDGSFLDKASNLINGGLHVVDRAIKNVLAGFSNIGNSIAAGVTGVAVLIAGGVSGFVGNLARGNVLGGTIE